MAKNIIWLASYPKSGNTWCRAFISSALGFGTINEHGSFAKFTSSCCSVHARNLFYGDDPKPEASLSMAWRSPYQALVSRRIGNTRHFCKTHSRYGLVEGNRLINPDVSAHAVVIVRNPIDVAASFANYMTTTPEMGVKMIANPFMTLNNRNMSQYLVSLGSWDVNVISWLTQSEIPVFLMRYEDMYFNREETFARFARTVLGIDDMEKIRAAIEASDFEALRAREQAVGFRENISPVNPFFWKGYPWHALEIYSPAQQMEIWKRHHIVAEALGYRFDGQTMSLAEPAPELLYEYRDRLMGQIEAPWAVPPELLKFIGTGSG